MNNINHIKKPIIIILITILCYLVLKTVSSNIEKNINRVEEIPSNTILSAYDTAKYIAKDISSYLNFTPKISVNNITVVNKETPILELSTLELKNVKHNYIWTNKWLGSEKSIEMIGYFDVKVGFDLDKELGIDINDTTKTIILSMPQPSILSIELKTSNLDSQNGLINKISDDDRNIVMNSFLQSAKKEINKNVYIEKSKKNLENVFNKILTKRLDDFIIRYNYKNKSL